MKWINYLLIFTAITLIVACGNDKPDVPLKTITASAKSVNPFPYYKSIEIKPGFHFEIVSWGKGVDTLGGYLILMSDSLRNNFRSVSVERKGRIIDSWNMDLDNDGNPEIYIQYVVRKNVNDLNVYEFNNNNFDKISFPGLESKLKNDYQGNDRFYVKKGDLFRDVPLVTSHDNKADKSVKTLKYSLIDNHFSSREVKPD